MFKLPNWKQLLWIVIFSVISVFLRHSETITANWIWWALAFVFVFIYGLLATNETQEEEKDDKNAKGETTTKEDRVEE